MTNTQRLRRPATWEDAWKWIDLANAKKDEHHEPKWDFDCGLKLDFDGPIIEISSRFYPPVDGHPEDVWSGHLHVMYGDRYIADFKFEAGTIDELREAVEAKAEEIQKAVGAATSQAIQKIEGFIVPDKRWL